MTTRDLTTQVYGIRHHGPGSARSLRAALAEQKPDIVLIEGPPEADALVPLAADPEMAPPVALLAYVPGEPGRAAARYRTPGALRGEQVEEEDQRDHEEADRPAVSLRRPARPPPRTPTAG